MPSYEELRIKEYQFWTLYLHGNQHYLGRAYVWLKRPGEMQRLSALVLEELGELWEVILSDYESVIHRLWGPDHMNYAWLGNEFAKHQGHGHLHLIPRYERPVCFAGFEFHDNRWGKNYAPYPKLEPFGFSDKTLFAIRDALREELE